LTQKVGAEELSSQAINFEFVRHWSLLVDANTCEEKVNLAKLLNSRVRGSLNAGLVAHLVEDDRNAVLLRELNDRFVTVLLRYIKDDKSFKVDVAEDVGETVPNVASTTTVKTVVRDATFKRLTGKKKL
jgi:hypothetical protein